ncbi:hypothetical protein FRB98_008394 [Tulasnella sp. 332]|nr:hypothetical protein FRB98_008394 [Tulasnella sp. 332]
MPRSRSRSPAPRSSRRKDVEDTGEGSRRKYERSGVRPRDDRERRRSPIYDNHAEDGRDRRYGPRRTREDPGRSSRRDGWDRDKGRDDGRQQRDHRYDQDIRRDRPPEADQRGIERYGGSSGPPPPPRRRSPSPDGEVDKAKPNFSNSGLLAAATNTVKHSDGGATVLKYNEPPEARKPSHGWRLYVFKGKEDAGVLHIEKQSAYLIGRDHIVADIPIDHPSCSKQHAVIQFRQVQEKNEYGDSKAVVKPFIIDLESTNGTHVNDDTIPVSRYYELKASDVFSSGTSAPTFVYDDPSDDEDAELIALLSLLASFSSIPNLLESITNFLTDHVFLPLVSVLAAFFPKLPLLKSHLIPTVYTSRSQPVAFSTKRRGSDEKLVNESKRRVWGMEEFVSIKCPSLRKPFEPPWQLPNGHAQTINSAFADYTDVDLVEYDRGLDFTPRKDSINSSELDPKTPTIVIAHGLTGGSYESYIRCILSTACKPKREGGLGYRAVVVNFRGCSGVKLKTYQIYSPGYTDDFRTALLYISNLYPAAPLLGIGFSFGGSVVARYAGEEGSRSWLKAACSLGCPWDLVSEDKRLDNSFLLRKVYSAAMATNVIALIKENLESIRRGPKIPGCLDLDGLLALPNPTFHDITEFLTSKVGGHPSSGFPFKTAAAFCKWASAEQRIQGIRVPYLILNAVDDPCVKNIPYEAVEMNGWVALVTTAHGGHLGWFERERYHEVKDRQLYKRWFRKPVLEWLQACAEDLVDVRVGERSGCVENGDGWVRQNDNSLIAYKIVGIGMEAKQKEAGVISGL